MGSVYLVRHGQTTCNRDGIIQGPRIDSELSDLGHRQAAAVGRALRDAGLDAIYTSPLMRARQTAQAVLEGHEVNGNGRPVLQVASEIYEFDYGALAGQHVDSVRDEVAQILDAWRMGFPDQSFPGGESALLAQVRVRPFVDRLLRQARDENVAVVAHGRINRVLMATLQHVGLDRLEDFPQSNACINELKVEADGVVLVRSNDVRHLGDGDLNAFS